MAKRKKNKRAISKKGRKPEKNQVSLPCVPVEWAGEPRFVIFFIPLRESLPIPIETMCFKRAEKVDWLEAVTFWPTPESREKMQPISHEGENFVSLKFWQRKSRILPSSEPFDLAMEVAKIVSRRKTSKTGSSKKEKIHTLPNDQIGTTIIEAVTPLLPELDLENNVNLDLSLSSAFDRCLHHIEELAEAYRIASSDLYSTPVTRCSVYFAVPWTSREPADVKSYGGIGIFLTNVGEQHITAPKSPISHAEVDKTALILERTRKGDPLVAASRSRWVAYRALRIESDTVTAVIQAATSSEMFFNTVIQMIAWEETVSPNDAAVWFDQGLSKRLRTYYGPKLGGNWDTCNQNAPLGNWSKNLQFCRNKTVHDAYVPSIEEAEAALNAGDEALDFLMSRLCEKRNEYPRTTLLLLGRPGLERRGLYAGKIKTFVEKVAASENDWLIEYNTWAKELEKALANSTLKCNS
ncbi:MAG: hypothetical protein JJD96_06085 [Thermoleophilia bacterium]|nr:hypothetical protein [Thermoleophilia bacterium]